MKKKIKFINITIFKTKTMNIKKAIFYVNDLGLYFGITIDKNASYYDIKLEIDLALYLNNISCNNIDFFKGGEITMNLRSFKNINFIELK